MNAVMGFIERGHWFAWGVMIALPFLGLWLAEWRRERRARRQSQRPYWAREGWWATSSKGGRRA